MTLTTVFQTDWFGPTLLMLGSILLAVTVSQSELFIASGILGVLVALWIRKQPNRWVGGLATVFVWSMLLLALRSLELPGQSASALVLFVIITLVVLWMIGDLSTRGLAVAQALALGSVEVFFILLFWPINFPSRALLLALTVAIGIEVIQRAGQGTLTGRALVPSLSLSLAVLVGIVVTADWFGF